MTNFNKWAAALTAETFYDNFINHHHDCDVCPANIECPGHIDNAICLKAFNNWSNKEASSND